MSIVSGSLGAVLGAQSQRDASNANERNVANANAANLTLDIMARGGAAPRGVGSGRGRVNLPASVVGTQSAVLPYYFNGAESQLANASTDLFNASYGLDSTRRVVQTSSNPRYADPVNGAANVATDRARLQRLRQQLQAASNGMTDSASVRARGDLRESISTLESQLVGATDPQTVSGINPGIAGAIQDNVTRDQNIVAGYEPEVQAGDELVSDLFSGELTNTMLGEAAPAQAARIRLANMEKDAGIEALQDKLNEIRTLQARKGFTGDSLAKHRLEFDARRRIGTDAARAIGGAELENALETKGIKTGARDLTFRSLDVPFNRAGQRINLANLPTVTAGQRFAAAMQPMQFFRTGGAQFNYQGAPERSSVPGAGQIIATAAGAAGNAAGNYFLNRPRTTTATTAMPRTVTGPSGQQYYDTGNSYAPVGTTAGTTAAAGAVAGAFTNDAWMDAVAESLSY